MTYFPVTSRAVLRAWFADTIHFIRSAFYQSIYSTITEDPLLESSVICSRVDRWVEGTTNKNEL